MSRVLAQLLGADVVSFRQQVGALEQTAGLPSTDIRLSTDVLQATKRKIAELGLDPADTTGQELYRVLQSRLCRDEVSVRASMNLRADIPPVEVVQEVARRLGRLKTQGDLYVVKQTVIKQLIKKQKPKATMKKLGYRSMDSMLKHESVAQLLAACRLCESKEWQEMFFKAYQKLQPKDFELRKPQCIVPVGKKWPELADIHADARKNNVVSVPELGSIVVLPMSRDLPGLAITTFAVALHALNDMRALSSYLKLQQVQPNFGELVSKAMQAEPMTQVELGGANLSWKMVHWFYGHGHAQYHPEVFEPHVQPEDLLWHRVGNELAALHPSLVFWAETDKLGLLTGNDVVSLNVLDVAIGVCNGLDYSKRVLRHMRESLGRELFGRYVQQEHLQRMLGFSLGSQFSPEVAFTPLEN